MPKEQPFSETIRQQILKQSGGYGTVRIIDLLILPNLNKA
jgi:hypothetical protein